MSRCRPPRPVRRIPIGLPSRAPSPQVLHDAGFRHVYEASQEVPWPWPGSPEQYWTYRCETGARFRQYLASLHVAAQASVHNEVLASIGAYYDGQQVNFTAVIVIASGVR
ncbi:MAG TPA: hypothetical protein VI542_01060 [Candidatus Tectomicrobia bacterium]